MKRLALIAILFATSNAWAAFTYYSPIDFDHIAVPSDQTDFPILISLTDARFKTVANSGHVQNSSGFDIRPYTSSALSSAYTYELERYNASTGEVIMWVKIPTLSHTTNTVVYLAYGDSGISTDGSSSSTWSNSFVSVHHLKDGTTLSVVDSAHALGTTNHSATATSGQIDGAASFVSASSQYAEITAISIGTTGFTFSALVNGTSFPNAYNTPIGVNCSGNGNEMYVKSNGKLAMYVQAGPTRSYDGTGSHTLSTSTWYHITMTYSASAGLVGYVNGASDGTATANGSVTASTSAMIGQDPITASRFWNGKLDEVRTASVARSSDWIAIESANQLTPGAVLTLDTEVSIGTSTKGFFYFFP